MDGFIDMTSIYVFLIENHVPALLVDVYYYLSYRHAKKKWMIAFCDPLLYQWLLEHLPKTWSFMEQKDDSWPQRLGSLWSSDLSWYSREYVGMEIIFNCGDFPNLPLIGTQGCINSNLILLVRQLWFTWKYCFTCQLNSHSHQISRVLMCFTLKIHSTQYHTIGLDKFSFESRCTKDTLIEVFMVITGLR